MSALKISIPKPKSGHTFSIGTQSEEISSWVKALPLFDATTTVKKALPVLAELNRTEMDNTLRFYSMQLFADALLHPIEIIRKKYLSAPVPLTDRHKSTSHSIKCLFNEMAHGYKIIINQHLLTPDQRLSIDEITQIIQLSIHFIGRLILDRYLCYESQTPKTWLELTELYKLATTLCVESAPITTEGKKHPTIEQTYLQILLLVAIHPYRLTQGEAAIVYKLMGDWNQHCKIVSPPSNWVPTNELIIKPTSYSFVYHAAPDENPADISDIHIINIDSLKAFIQIHSENIKGQSSTLSERLMQNMFKRLLDGWRSNNARISHRTHCTNEIELISGINSCYLAFGGKDPKEDQPDHVKMRLIPIEDERDDPWAPVISNVHIEAGGASKFSVDDPTKDVWDKQTRRPSLSDIAKRPSFIRYTAIQTDYSDIGLSVNFNFSNKLQPHVGDLISFRTKKDPGSRWRLGAIRWMEFSQKDGSLGIKLFQFAPTPVATKALTGIGRGGDLMQCLLISPESIEHPEATIIVPASVYDTGTQLHVDLRKGSVKIMLASLQDFSKSFACYAFKIINI